MLELGHGSHDGRHESRRWSVLTRENQVLFKELDSDSSGRERPPVLKEVSRITCESIHAEHGDCVGGSDKQEQLVERRSDHNANLPDQDRN